LYVERSTRIFLTIFHLNWILRVSILKQEVRARSPKEQRQNPMISMSSFWSRFVSHHYSFIAEGTRFVYNYILLSIEVYYVSFLKNLFSKFSFFSFSAANMHMFGILLVSFDYYSHWIVLIGFYWSALSVPCSENWQQFQCCYPQEVVHEQG
jgi:hypothetical protein